MSRRTTRVLAAVLLTVGSALVVPHAASANDGCGSDWYKESDGYLTKDGSWESGDRRATIWHSGRVRFCTQNDTFNDDENRRAIIGYESDTYPFESLVFNYGGYSAFCVKQTIKVHMSGIKTSESWSLGGSISKDGPGVEASYSATYDTLTVTMPGAKACDPDKDRLAARTSGITVTAQDQSGEVEWVELHTVISGTFNRNGTKIAFSHAMTERDNS